MKRKKNKKSKTVRNRLQNILRELKRAVDMAERVGLGTLEDEEFEAYLATLPKQLGLDPDGYKTMMDLLVSKSYEHGRRADIADRTGRAMVYAAGFLQDALIKRIQAEKVDRICGQTWEMSIEPKEDRIEIEDEELVKKSVQTKVETVTRIDHAFLLEAIKEGKEIPGVKVIPQFVLHANVIKRKEASDAGQEASK